MPTYEYECGACGHSFEALQSMVEPKLKKCPVCKKSKLHRLIGSGSGIIFKGTGFYQTDYKKSSPKTESKPNSAASTEPAKCAGGCACHGGGSAASKTKGS